MDRNNYSKVCNTQNKVSFAKLIRYTSSTHEFPNEGGSKQLFESFNTQNKVSFAKLIELYYK